MSFAVRLGGSGITYQAPSNISLAAGELYVVPSGTYVVQPGPYTFLQWFDSTVQSWRTFSNPVGRPTYVNSDGANWRLANLTGCPIGALITNVGSGYTSAPVVTASAGGSTWQAIVGGAVNTSATITSGGSNYQFAPTLIVSSPPQGGLQATATCTISNGAINAATIVNQGAGYASAPTVQVVNDPRDTLGSGAVITLTLTGANTITGLTMLTPGTPQTSVPTLSISGGGGSGAAATAIMSFALTGYTVTTAGTGYATSVLALTSGGVTSGTAAITNPAYMGNLLVPRHTQISNPVSAGALATGGVISDNGLFQVAPSINVINNGGAAPTTAGTLTATVGGVSDTSVLQPV